MEELKCEWKDVTIHIAQAIEFLDTFFKDECPNDKTAYEAYLTLKACAMTYINVGNRLADERSYYGYI